jgi:hypothetical protein
MPPEATPIRLQGAEAHCDGSLAGNVLWLAIINQYLQQLRIKEADLELLIFLIKELTLLFPAFPWLGSRIIEVVSTSLAWRQHLGNSFGCYADKARILSCRQVTWRPYCIRHIQPCNAARHCHPSDIAH